MQTAKQAAETILMLAPGDQWRDRGQSLGRAGKTAPVLRCST